jgi:hypothetical protein
MNLFRARTDKLLRTDLEDEVVIYDPERKQAHSLNKVAVAVWNHADGKSSIEDVQKRVIAELGVPVGEAEVWLALKKLERAHLLMAKLTSAHPMTRREAIGKGARIGAAAAVTPLVASVLVPTAAAAASLARQTCPNGGSCGNYVIGSCGGPGCTCLTTADGGGFCYQIGTSPVCPPPCAADNTCPPGGVCATNTCCGNVCLTPAVNACGVLAPAARPGASDAVVG